MPMPDIEALNRAISEAGANWTAAETPFSHMAGQPPSMEGLGLALTPEDAYPTLLAARASDATMMLAAPLPAAVDWRQYNGDNWVTPIRDQGSCGSCVAFATVATVEARVLIAEKRPGVDFDLSEASLFYCGTPNSCARGWQPLAALAYANSHGLGRESHFPYVPGNQPCKVVPAAAGVGNAVSAGMMHARKRALIEGPVIASFAVYDDFFSYGSGVYRHVVGNLAGYHAVCVIGYDDDAGCWIAKNSWSANWGENGFFRIRYGECGIDSQFTFDYPDSVSLVPETTIP